MDTSTLSIPENKKQLVLKALNKYRTQHAAAQALGMNQTGLNRLAARLKIFKVDGEYVDKSLRTVEQR